jgi:hypothetical protein
MSVCILDAAADHVVVDDDFLHVFFDELIDRVRTDQTGTTHDDEFASF